MSTLDRPRADLRVPIDTILLPRAIVQRGRLQSRREALLALDPLVRRQLRQLSAPALAQTVELTVYDAVYAATPQVGGHWTATTSWFGLFSHAFGSYSVALVFDDADRPRHFAVTGAASVESDGVSEAALGRALAQAGSAGPLRTSSAHVFQLTGL